MKSSLLLLALPCALLTACVDDPAPAHELKFESWRCGQTVCDLTAPLATGSVLQLAFPEQFHLQLEGATIESSDPSIVRVGAIETGSYLTTEVTGVAPGNVELFVIDASGAVLDSLPVRVRTPDRLRVQFSLATSGSMRVVESATLGIEHAVEVSPRTGVHFNAIGVAKGEVTIGAFSDYVVDVRSTAPAHAKPSALGDAKTGAFDVYPSGFEDIVTIRRAGLSTTARMTVR